VQGSERVNICISKQITIKILVYFGKNPGRDLLKSVLKVINVLESLPSYALSTGSESLSASNVI